jgi:hypothetical protein
MAILNINNHIVLKQILSLFFVNLKFIVIFVP